MGTAALYYLDIILKGWCRIVSEYAYVRSGAAMCAACDYVRGSITKNATIYIVIVLVAVSYI